MGKNIKELKESFEYVRKEYFSRWDKGGKWRIRKNTNLGCNGLCDKEKMVISINTNMFPPEDLLLVIIHEICHGSTGGNHGKSWQKRMLWVSKTVKQKGDPFLVKKIVENIEGYKNAPNPYEEVYGIIEDWLIDNPELTYDQLIKGLQRDYGGATKKDWERKYKRLRKVFIKHKGLLFGSQPIDRKKER